jgi:hypothetical protein
VAKVEQGCVSIGAAILGGQFCDYDGRNPYGGSGEKEMRVGRGDRPVWLILPSVDPDVCDASALFGDTAMCESLLNARWAQVVDLKVDCLWERRLGALPNEF